MANGISFQTQQQLNNLERGFQPTPIAPRQGNNTWTPLQVEEERARLQMQEKMAPISHERFKIMEAEKLRQDVARQESLRAASEGYKTPEQEEMQRIKDKLSGGFNSLFGFGK